MTDPDRKQARKNSRDRSIDVLHDNGFRRIGPSNVFKNNDDFLLLSPATSEGADGACLFDIRVANLDKMKDPSKAALLLRLEPEWFAFIKLELLSPYLTEAILDHGVHSGELYGFSCEIDENERTVTIVSTKDPSVSLSTDLHDRDRMAHILGRLRR